MSTNLEGPTSLKLLLSSLSA